MIFVSLFVLGSVIGSFFAAWMYRLHVGEKIWKGRSHCPSCKKNIAPTDLIPIISFFLLKGKCRHCKAKISSHYPLTEILMGLVFLFVAIFYDLSIHPKVFLSVFLSIFLVAIFVSDLFYQEIPFSFTLWPAGILLFLNLFFGLKDWKSMVLGVIIAAGFFGLQFLISKGKWIGGGDIAMGVLMGVALGWFLTVFALILAYSIGAGIGIFLLFLKKAQRKTQFPFGSLLSTATFISYFLGGIFFMWYSFGF